MRRVFSIFMVAFLLCAIGGCQSSGTSAWPEGKGPKVLVSFPPLYSFATSIAGEDAVVKSFLTTSGPHSHGDPSSDQIEVARGSDVLFINGIGLDEGLANKLKRRASKKDWSVVELGKLFDEKKELLEGACHHDHGPGTSHEDHDHGFDPHVWLDTRKASRLVNGIRDELKKRDPSHATGYDERAKVYAAKLEQLRDFGIGLLKDKKQKKFVSFHDSLRYFADCYGLEVAAAIQVDPGVEPSAAKMNEIIEHCLKNKITVIAVEPQFPSNTSAKAILSALRDKGVDAQFAEIDPLETAEAADLSPDLYERRMRSNLENLAKALQ